MDPSLGDIALTLATDRGWHLIPLWGIASGRCDCGKPGCRDAGKHPHGRLVPSGLKQATRAPYTVREWWETDPNANIGIVAGPSGLLIIDVDGQGGIKAWEALEAKHGAADTFTVRTGRTDPEGYHLYYTLPDDVELPRNNISLGDHLDTRHGAGYVVGPGSLHASDQRYEVVVPRDPEPAPAWLIEELRKQARRGLSLVVPNGASVSEFQVPDGQGNTWLTSMAGTLVNRGIVGDALHDHLQLLNLRHMRADPMPEEAVRKVANSVSGYGAPADAIARAIDPTGEAELLEMAGVETHVHGKEVEHERVAATGEYMTGQVALVLAQDSTDEGFATTVETLAGPGGVKWVQGIGWAAWDGTRWHLDIHGAGECVIRDLLEDAAVMWDAAAAQVSDHGRAPKQVEKEQERLHKRAAALRNERTRTSGLKRLALRAHLRTDVDVWDSRDFVTGLPGGKVLDLRPDGSYEVRKARREDMVTKELAADVIEGVEAPLWTKLLERVIPDEDLRDYLQRWAGYLLTGSIEEQAVAFLHGQGQNGKSTIVDTLKELLGDYAQPLLVGALISSSGSAGELASLAQMRGARFATAVEPKMEGQLNTSMVKSATGDTEMVAKFMRENPITFRMRAKVWIATNHEPSIPDNDNGIWRRVKMIPFNERIPDDEVDLTLGAKLRGEGDHLGELPGILNWMLEGYQQWRTRGLAEPDVVKRATKAYRKREDIFGAFLEETYEIHPRPSEAPKDMHVDCKNLMDACVEWYQEHRFDTPNSKQIAGELKTRDIVRKQIRVKSVRAWVYPGLRPVLGLRSADRGEEEAS